MLLGERSLVRSQVLLVDAERTRLRNGDRTFADIGTVVGVIKVVRTAVDGAGTDVGRDVQPLDGRHGRKPVAVDRISIGAVTIQVDRDHGVGTARERAYLVGIHTRVVDLIAVFVVHDLLIGIAHIHRVDRGNHVGQVEQVARRTPVGLPRRGVGNSVRETDIATDLQPLLGLVIGLHTGRITGEARILDDARIVEVTGREVVVEAFRSTRDGDVVLLAQVAAAEQLVVPIVGGVVILPVGVAQFGVGIEFAVGTDQRLAFGKRVDVVTRTAVRRVEQGGVGKRARIRRRAPGIELTVVQSFVAQFVIQSRIGNHVVIGHTAGVGTPLGVEGHGRILRLAALGGDQHDAVGTAGTVDGRRGGILQHRDRLDIGTVQERERPVVRGPVHDIERSTARRHGANTTDTDLGTLTRLSVRRNSLHTGHGTRQGVRNVGYLALADILGLHHGSRTRKGLFFGRTVCYHDHVVNRLRILLHHDVHTGFSGDSNTLGLIADEGHQQNTLPGNRNRVSTVSTRRRSDRRSVHHDCGTCYRSTGSVGNCTGDLLVLGECICAEHQNSN